MSNFDQERRPLMADNIALNLGIVFGWGSYINNRPQYFDLADREARQYFVRGAALVRDIVQGTPNANASLYTCDVPDTEIPDKIAAYIPHVLTQFEARDRGVPNALQQIMERLRGEVVV